MVHDYRRHDPINKTLYLAMAGKVVLKTLNGTSRSHLNPMNWARYGRENPLSSYSTTELWGYFTVFTTSELVNNIPEIAA